MSSFSDGYRSIHLALPMMQAVDFSSFSSTQPFSSSTTGAESTRCPPNSRGCSSSPRDDAFFLLSCPELSSPLRPLILILESCSAALPRVDFGFTASSKLSSPFPSRRSLPISLLDYTFSVSGHRGGSSISAKYSLTIQSSAPYCSLNLIHLAGPPLLTCKREPPRLQASAFFYSCRPSPASSSDSFSSAWDQDSVFHRCLGGLPS